MKSRIKDELRWKYLEQKLRLPVFLGLVIWTAWVWQMTNAWPELVTINYLR